MKKIKGNLSSNMLFLSRHIKFNGSIKISSNIFTRNQFQTTTYQKTIDNFQMYLKNKYFARIQKGSIFNPLMHNVPKWSNRL